MHKVADHTPLEEAVLIEPYTIGAQAVYRGELQAGETLLIQGAGPIGICILKMAKLMDARVMISDLIQLSSHSQKNLVRMKLSM